MSSNYIYLSCSVEGCDTTESIYTGQVYTYEFDNAKWEGETISVPCNKHKPCDDCTKDKRECVCESLIADHSFQGVAGHDDDNECTFRSDGTDLTYCGEEKEKHHG